jgi:DNA-binding beta-propeller fold protein YncE
VGSFPAGGGYLFCYPAGAAGPNPANPFGGFAGAATTLNMPEGVTASAATNFFYATDRGANAVDEWNLPCPAPIVNVAPVRRVVGPATTLNLPIGVAVDVRRRLLYVANNGNNTVSIFRIGAFGNVPPICVLGGPATQLNGPAHIVVEPAIAGAAHPGWLYVANFGGASVTAYRPRSCGNVPPALTIKGPLTGLATPFGIDTYISQFPGHVGASAIYVGDPQVGQVFVYKDGPPVNQAPFQVLGGPASTLVCPSDVRVSSQTFLIYAEDPCANNGANPAGRIDAFAPNAVFNVAPALWYVAPPGIISSPLGLWLLDRN